MKTTVALLLTSLLVLPALAEERDDVIRKLSKRERKERIARLEIPFQEFVNDVEPIILPAELDLFLSLESESERNSFVDEFWRRRDHAQRTQGRFRETYYRRLDVVRQQFKQAGSDRARLFLLHGPPADVVTSNCHTVLQPTEIWKYPVLPGMGRDVRLLFYKPRHGGDYRLWNPLGGAVALADLSAAPDAVTQRTAEEAQRARGMTPSTSPYAYINRIQIECADGAEIMLAITQMVQMRIDLLKLFAPPELTAEGTQKLLSNMIVSNPNAPKLTTEFSVQYPAKDGSRTDAQMMLLVPRSELTAGEAGGQEVYSIDVAGEVLREGELWEKYRYRFDFPAHVDSEKLPVVIDRLLRPGDYTSRIKLTDPNGGGEALVEQKLTVPEIFTPEPVQAVTAETAVEAVAPVGEAAARPEDDREAVRLRIIPPREQIVSGMQTFETLATGAAIKAVEFWLDGRKIAVRRSPPWSLDLELGEVPQLHRIRAVALDAKGQTITGDELAVNTGTDPFRVRIVSPRIAPRVSGLTRVEMDVEIPDGEQLDALELYWNQTRMATLYDPPFVQSIDIPATEGVGYLRAVARLKNESYFPIEDAVVINSPSYMEQLDVHLIELPTTVTIGGKAAQNLTASAFKVLDEGKPVQVAKFDHVRDVPLSIGMAIDSSGSMQNRMEEAQKAGAQFFEQTLRKGDKAFLVAFDRTPTLVQKWSPRVADVLAGLAKVRPEDKTALYDAIVYSLYNFHGIRGQRALVVISDGRDTASKFTYDQAVEYARRSGVPIYGIGIGIRANEADVRFKFEKFCRETGGAVYYIEQARELQRVYDDIQAELRSQYILGFYPPNDAKPGKWREVTVQVTEGKARTIKGYYP